MCAGSTPSPVQMVKSSVGSTFGHGDGGAHVYAGVDGVEGCVGSQCVAADVAEYFVCGVFFGQHLGECDVHVTVSATFT